MDLSALTLTQLRYLLALDTHRGFRGAASACHVSQPALSAQIAKLEDLLGGPLFDRSKKPIVPTDLGCRLIPQARAVLREAERLGVLADADPERLSGRYRLGVIPTLAATILPRLLPRFSQLYPEVELVVEEQPTLQMLDALAEDQLDGGVAATPLNAPGIHEKVLFREAFFAFLPKGHPLLDRKTIRQKDMAALPMWLLSEGHCFRDQVLQLCGNHCPVESPSGIRLTFDGGTFDTLVSLVEGGLGATVIPALTKTRLSQEKQETHCRPFAAPVPTREVSLLFSREHLRRNIADRLGQVIKETVPRDMVPKGGRTRGLSLTRERERTKGVVIPMASPRPLTKNRRGQIHPLR